MAVVNWVGLGVGMDGKRERRKAMRLKGYDYAQDGVYFVTICTFDRTCLFGDVDAGEVQLNDLGRIVDAEWRASTELRGEIELDMWTVMPNHVRGIVFIANSGAYAIRPYNTQEGSIPRSPSKTLGAMIRGFKGATTARINQHRSKPGATVWQRNYYEHVIRDDEALNRIRQYIHDNPTPWALDHDTQ